MLTAGPAPTSTTPVGRVGGPRHWRLWLDAGWVVGTGLLLGAATSFAQGLLPDVLRSLANSPSGWTLLTVVVIAVRRPALLPAALLGALGFVSLVLGYTVASELRGLSYDPVLWGAIGLVAGPAVGWSTAALVHRRRSLNAVGSSFLAGVAIADSVYGLTVVAGTTSAVYWSVAGAAGVVLLVLVAVRRRFGWTHVAAQVGLTVGWVGLASAAYATLNAM